MGQEILWIWCDIDGRGEKWRLAVGREDGYYFPVEDFEDSHDYDGHPKLTIDYPCIIPGDEI